MKRKIATLALGIISVLFVLGCTKDKVKPVKMSSRVNPDNPQVIMVTSLGEIHIELFKKYAPITVANFLRYVDSKYYDGTIFHRVISNFMIQGGGMLPGLNKKPGFEPIKNEAKNGLSNLRGTIAMARTGVIDSATSQFFINVVDNYSLDHRDESRRGYGYCVFGRVIRGMNVVDKIKNVDTQTVAYYQNVPSEDIVIQSVRRVKR